MKKLSGQILRFGVVGALAFVIDYGLLIFCTEVLGINYLISSAIAFSIAVIFNYILSTLWVFDTSENRQNKQAQFAAFVILSIIGLGLTELLMWLGTDVLGIYYLITKIGATGIVMIYNFVTRKMLTLMLPSFAANANDVVATPIVIATVTASTTAVIVSRL